jgi:hypothetical protein
MVVKKRDEIEKFPARRLRRSFRYLHGRVVGTPYQNGDRDKKKESII